MAVRWLLNEADEREVLEALEPYFHEMAEMGEKVELLGRRMADLRSAVPRLSRLNLSKAFTTVAGNLERLAEDVLELRDRADEAFRYARMTPKERQLRKDMERGEVDYLQTQMRKMLGQEGPVE